jgi:hypothetical protein
MAATERPNADPQPSPGAPDPPPEVSIPHRSQIAVPPAAQYVITALLGFFGPMLTFYAVIRLVIDYAKNRARKDVSWWVLVCSCTWVITLIAVVALTASTVSTINSNVAAGTDPSAPVVINPSTGNVTPAPVNNTPSTTAPAVDNSTCPVPPITGRGVGDQSAQVVIQALLDERDAGLRTGNQDCLMQAWGNASQAVNDDLAADTNPSAKTTVVSATSNNGPGASNGRAYDVVLRTSSGMTTVTIGLIRSDGSNKWSLDSWVSTLQQH